jgi:Poly(ADP-ribose) polymerase and DNA-Ligase Zn-finger region
MAYRVEYARSGRSACKGPIPCKGTKIEKGGLRLGTVIEIRGDRSLVWRHWGCVTDRIISNLRESIGDPEDLDGVEELNEEDQKKISDAFANGHVAEEDVTLALIEAGKGPGGTPSSSPQKKTPQKKAGGKKKAKKEEFDEEEEEEEWKADESEEDVKPKKKNRASTKVKNEEVELSPTFESKAVKKEENGNHVEQPPKKRGRAAKAKSNDAETASVNVKEEEQDVHIDEKPKKKRGRNAVKTVTEEPAPAKVNGKKAAEPTKAPEEKKRGRSAKGAVKEEESIPAVEDPPAKEQTGRKRGRTAKSNGNH